MKESGKINYIELPASNIIASKEFFSEAFGWSFIDYGPDYSAFDNAGLDGGIFRSELKATTDTGSALVVIYSDNLEVACNRVKACGGDIVREIFSFPGGRRFHFSDPSGNEFAVWSEPSD